MRLTILGMILCSTVIAQPGQAQLTREQAIAHNMALCEQELRSTCKDIDLVYAQWVPCQGPGGAEVPPTETTSCLGCYNRFDNTFYWQKMCLVYPKGALAPPSAMPFSEEPVCKSGSIIDVDNQILGESLPLVGTALSLSYATDRTPGWARDFTLKLPLESLADPDETILDIRVNVAGQLYHQSVIPSRGQFFELAWDGLDATGQVVQGTSLAEITYTKRLHLGGSFANDPDATEWGYTIAGVSHSGSSAPEMTVEVTERFPIGTRNALFQGLGAWTISAHHFYDHARGVVMTGDGRRRTVKAVPSATGSRVASEDGREVYDFDVNGNHLQTLHGFTGAPLLQFRYDAAAKLVSITDGDGNQTMIIRNANGVATGIVSPYHQLTELEVDADGLLNTLRLPTGNAYTMTYWDRSGLLKTFRTPNGLESTFTYDNHGRLLQDANNGGSAWMLSLLENAKRRVSIASAEGRTSYHDIEASESAGFLRTSVEANGTVSTYANNAGYRELRGPTGRVFSAQAFDPRFGEQAPYDFHTRVETGAHVLESFVSQSATLADANDPFSIEAITVETTTNGNRATAVYDGRTRTTTMTTPEGRQAVVTIDSTGRAVAEQLGTRTPVHYTYDARGRLAQVTQGARTTTLTYHPSGFVHTVTDPLGRTTAFQYDAAGRVTRQILPDGRGIGLAYDADGNLTGVTPPGRAQHRLTRWLQGDLHAYRPPTLGIDERIQTTYTLQPGPAVHPHRPP